MENHKLKKPIKDGDETIKELELDFESLTYKDFERADKAVRLKFKKENLTVPETNKKFLAHIVAYASKRTPEDIFNLGLSDFCQLTMLAANFLLGSDSEDQDPTETEMEMETETETYEDSYNLD